MVLHYEEAGREEALLQIQVRGVVNARHNVVENSLNDGLT
jgi:hypothetical protein